MLGMGGAPVTLLQLQIGRAVWAWYRKDAHSQVYQAIQRGALPALSGSVKCVDCAIAPADVYDHRDYTKPLQVEPVCYGCNRARGPAALDSTAVVDAVASGIFRFRIDEAKAEIAL